MNLVMGGNHKLALEVLKSLVKNFEKPKLVISEGLDSVWETNFENEGGELAKKEGIKFFVGDINSFENEITEVNPDLIILCRCKKRIQSKILNIPKIGCTNIHYGLLPRYGGIAPIHWAIRNGEEEIGITFQFMSEEFDEGDVIAQETYSTKGPKRTVNICGKIFEINGITSWEAYNIANDLGLKLFQENFEKMKNEKFSRKKQNLQNKLYYTKDSIDYQKDRILNLNEKSNIEISNLIRAFTFPPCQLPATYINNELVELKIES